MNYQVVKKTKPSEVAKAGITGAAIGVGVALAANKFMSDKENREKVKEVLSHAKDTLNQVKQSALSQADDAKHEVGNRVDREKAKVEKKKEGIKKDAKKAIDDL